MASASDHAAGNDRPLYFWGHGATSEYGWMSQWFISEFTVDGNKFNCCEQWMMWSKAKLFSDEANAKAVLNATSPKAQKALGRKVANFDGKKWDQEKCRIVEEGNYHKFTQGKHQHFGKPLSVLLLQTGDREIVEASPYDSIWGIGHSAESAEKVGRDQWGENLLGKALVAVRRRLKQESN